MSTRQCSTDVSIASILAFLSSFLSTSLFFLSMFSSTSLSLPSLLCDTCVLGTLLHRTRCFYQKGLWKHSTDAFERKWCSFVAFLLFCSCFSSVYISGLSTDPAVLLV